MSDYHNYKDNLAFPPIGSQDDLNEQGRDSEVLIKAIEKCEKLEKQLKIAVKYLRRYARGKHYRGMINPEVVEYGDWAKEALKKLGVRS